MCNGFFITKRMTMKEIMQNQPFLKEFDRPESPENLELQYHFQTSPVSPGFSTRVEPKKPFFLSKSQGTSDTPRPHDHRHFAILATPEPSPKSLHHYLSPWRIHGTIDTYIYVHLFHKIQPFMWVNISKVAPSLEKFNWYKAIRNEEFNERRVPSFNDFSAQR